MADTFTEHDWSSLQSLHPDNAVDQFNSVVFSAMQACIPKKAIKQKQSSHPWLNNRVKAVVSDKAAA